MRANQPLILAVPKGRILKELEPLLSGVGIEPEAAFNDPSARQLQFATNIPELSIIRVRSFDVATFVAFGAAHLGVAGNDVLMEFDYAENYAPVDLKIGACRLSIAEPRDMVESDDPDRWSHIRVATKYPSITRKYFAARGVSDAIDKAQGLPGVPPLTDLDHEALQMFRDVAIELAVEIPFEHGDLFYLCNHVTLHSRKSFEDWSEPERKRHLFRLWLSTKGARPLPPEVAERSEGVYVDGTVFTAPVDVD